MSGITLMCSMIADLNVKQSQCKPFRKLLKKNQLDILVSLKLYYAGKSLQVCSVVILNDN